jgi:hypothetical protein
MKLTARRTNTDRFAQFRIIRTEENGLEWNVLDLRMTRTGWDIRPLHTDEDELHMWAHRARQLKVTTKLPEALALIRTWIESDDAEAKAQYESETYAETAWLRVAEAPTNDDLGFEQWEMSRGVFDGSPSYQDWECNEGRYL